MKAGELMLKDWVVDNSKKHPSKIRVTDVLEDGINPIFTGDGSELDDFIGEDEIRPIPLTEEILKANGWYYDEMNCVWIHDICPLELFSPWEKNGGYVLSNYNSITFKFVHELQHALRLCGLNDLADNFKVE